VEAHGQLMLSANVRRPGTKYKCSNIAFAITSIAFIVVHVCTELLQLPVQFPIGGPGTTRLTFLGICVVQNHGFITMSQVCKKRYVINFVYLSSLLLSDFHEQSIDSNSSGTTNQKNWLMNKIYQDIKLMFDFSC